MLRFLLLALGLAGTIVIGFAGFYHRVGWLVVGALVYVVGHLSRELQILRAERSQVSVKHRSVRAELEHMNERLWPKNANFRSTVLLPDGRGHYLHPGPRYQFGQRRGRTRSTARFARGVAVAGLAWARPAVTFKRENIGPFPTAADFLAFYRNEFKLSDEDIKRLSKYMQNVRSICCRGLVNRNRECIGVLSIDSTDSAPFTADIQKRLTYFIQQVQLQLED